MIVVTQTIGFLEDRCRNSDCFSKWRRLEKVKRRRRNRRGLLLLAVVVALLLAYTESSWTRAEPRGHIGHGQIRFGQRGPEAWHWEWHKRGVLIRSLRRQRAGLKRQLAAYEPKREATRMLASSSPWDSVAQCESGGDWAYNGSSGYDGGLQFHPGTWSAYRPAGYPAFAYQASREQQIAVAERVLAEQGWAAWPTCSSRIGLR